MDVTTTRTERTIAVINSVAIAGRVSSVGDARKTSSGNPMLLFTVVVSEYRPNADGGWDERPNFFDVAAFGPLAGRLAGRVTVGSKVTVQGRLRQTSRTDAAGMRQSRVGIVAAAVDVTPASGRKTEQAERDGPHDDKAQSMAGAPEDDLFDEDIPF